MGLQLLEIEGHLLLVVLRMVHELVALVNLLRVYLLDRRLEQLHVLAVGLELLRKPSHRRADRRLRANNHATVDGTHRIRPDRACN